MHDLDLLVPAALVESTLAAELLRDETLPHVARFLAHARIESTTSPADAPLTTWQAWVFGRRAGVERVAVVVGRAVFVHAGHSPRSGSRMPLRLCSGRFPTPTSFGILTMTHAG